jgi:carbamate kinase
MGQTEGQEKRSRRPGEKMQPSISLPLRNVWCQRIECDLIRRVAEGAVDESLLVAFGGNAILPSRSGGSLEEQRENVRRMSTQVGRLILNGHRMIVTHGNGPQVGEIMLRSHAPPGEIPSVSLDVAGAMSQGQIGYMLQQEIGDYLRRHGNAMHVCTVLTQVVVDANDPAFINPTKPIGRFYSKDAASRLRRRYGWTLADDAGRGYRRLVPSPEPKDIVEWPAIQALVDSGGVVIAAGGGGIPVVRQGDGCLTGVEAVIDKDLAAQRLGSLLGARCLVMVTEVEAVTLHFGTPNQRRVGMITVQDLATYQSQGHFPAGSMGPKVQAAIQFVREGGHRAIITSADNLVAAVYDPSIGTQVSSSVPMPAKQGSAAS